MNILRWLNRTRFARIEAHQSSVCPELSMKGAIPTPVITREFHLCPAARARRPRAPRVI